MLHPCTRPQWICVCVCVNLTFADGRWPKWIHTNERSFVNSNFKNLSNGVPNGFLKSTLFGICSNESSVNRLRESGNSNVGIFVSIPNMSIGFDESFRTAIDHAFPKFCMLWPLVLFSATNFFGATGELFSGFPTKVGMIYNAIHFFDQHHFVCFQLCCFLSVLATQPKVTSLDFTVDLKIHRSASTIPAFFISFTVFFFSIGSAG